MYFYGGYRWISVPSGGISGLHGRGHKGPSMVEGILGPLCPRV